MRRSTEDGDRFESLHEIGERFRLKTRCTDATQRVTALWDQFCICNRSKYNGLVLKQLDGDLGESWRLGEPGFRSGSRSGSRAKGFNAARRASTLASFPSSAIVTSLKILHLGSKTSVHSPLLISDNNLDRAPCLVHRPSTAQDLIPHPADTYHLAPLVGSISKPPQWPNANPMSPLPKLHPLRPLRSKSIIPVPLHNTSAVTAITRCS